MANPTDNIPTPEGLKDTSQLRPDYKDLPLYGTDDATLDRLIKTAKERGLSERDIVRLVVTHTMRVATQSLAKTGGDLLTKNAGMQADQRNKSVTDAAASLADAVRINQALEKKLNDNYLDRHNSLQSDALEAGKAPHKMMASIGSFMTAIGALVSLSPNHSELGEAMTAKGIAMGKDAMNAIQALEKENKLYPDGYKPDIKSIYTREKQLMAERMIKQGLDPELVRETTNLSMDAATGVGKENAAIPSQKEGAARTARRGTPVAHIPNFGASTVAPYSKETLDSRTALVKAPSEYDPIFVEMAEKYASIAGVTPEVFARHLKTRAAAESALGRNVDNGGSGANGERALGVMQLEIRTGKALGLKTEADFLDPRKNIEAASRHTANLADKYGWDNVHQYYYGGENTKAHGKNTMQYVANMRALDSQIEQAGIQVAARNRPERVASADVKSTPQPQDAQKQPARATAEAKKPEGEKPASTKVSALGHDSGASFAQLSNQDTPLTPRFMASAAANEEAYKGTSTRGQKLDAGQAVVALSQDGQEVKKDKVHVAVNQHPLQHFSLNMG